MLIKMPFLLIGAKILLIEKAKVTRSKSFFLVLHNPVCLNILQWQDRNYKPQSGDIIFFDWGNDGSIDHVGSVEKCENGTVYIIEGNAGAACRQQNYPVGISSIYGYGVPQY